MDQQPIPEAAGLESDRDERAFCTPFGAQAVEDLFHRVPDKVEVLQRKYMELKQFVETASIPLHWVEADGTIQWANDAELRLVGCAREEYVGRNIREFHADSAVVEDMLRRLTAGERLKDFTARLRTRKGEIRQVLIDSCALRDGERFLHTQCFTRDVTDQLRGQEADRRLTAIVESSDDAIISKDVKGVITTWNKSAERIFGYAAHEAIGRPITLIIPPELQDEEPRILAKILGGERIDHYETVRRRKDGTLVDISLSVSSVKDASGRIVGASKIARDISRSKQAETELKAARDQLARANEVLEQKVQERTAALRQALEQMEEFSYSLSHDLRAPARAMKCYADIALEEFGHTFVPEVKEYLERIIRCGARMDALIQDVLIYSRLSRREVEMKPVELEKVVTDLVYQYPQMQAPRAEVIIQKPLLPVLAHEPSLTQALANLLTNAVKFVAPDTLPRVRVRTEPAGNRVRIWVEDNGIGISPSYQSRAFGVFERLHPNADYEGTGIGLAIVRKAAEKMGGAVGLESDGTTGTRFWIELARPDEDRALCAGSEPAPMSSNPDKRSRRPTANHEPT